MAELNRRELTEEEIDLVDGGLELDIMKVYELASKYHSVESVLRTVRDNVGEKALNRIRDNWQSIESSDRIPNNVKNIVARFVL